MNHRQVEYAGQPTATGWPIRLAIRRPARMLAAVAAVVDPLTTGGYWTPGAKTDSQDG